ncbi:hypothetical protein N8I77_005687 [Diaporthe amygdali]|uniref:Uncharacterized protein n=1 Tax=Phomopsis amygdali TaxID=1214568 RepID=A0AAD9SHN0_PHOAM|nr:hypothetical protein N8I77_005687 [Diaporthe amygdali]
MRSFTLITFIVMTLFYTLCSAAPSQAKLPLQISRNTDALANTSVPSTLPTNLTLTDTGVFRAKIPDFVNPDIWKNLDRCYYWNGNEKWNDVGGQFSQFLHTSLHDTCDLIATFASNEGFKKDQTIDHCKQVPANTQGKDYERSIGVSLTYRGPDYAFKDINANYCYDLLAKPLGCGAGGEFIIQYGDAHEWWEVKADPNKGDCFKNGYSSAL